MNEERAGKCLRQVKHIRGHLWHRCSIAVNQIMVANLKTFEVMTSTLPRGTPISVASLLADTLYQVQNLLCYMHINFYFYQTVIAFNMLTMMHMASVLLRTKLIVCYAQLNF